MLIYPSYTHSKEPQQKKQYWKQHNQRAKAKREESAADDDVLRLHKFTNIIATKFSGSVTVLSNKQLECNFCKKLRVVQLPSDKEEYQPYTYGKMKYHMQTIHHKEYQQMPVAQKKRKLLGGKDPGSELPHAAGHKDGPRKSHAEENKPKKVLITVKPMTQSTLSFGFAKTSSNDMQGSASSGSTTTAASATAANHMQGNTPVHIHTVTRDSHFLPSAMHWSHGRIGSSR